jgi:hypothetical protein
MQHAVPQTHLSKPKVTILPNHQWQLCTFENITYTFLQQEIQRQFLDRRRCPYMADAWMTPCWKLPNCPCRFQNTFQTILSPGVTQQGPINNLEADTSSDNAYCAIPLKTWNEVQSLRPVSNTRIATTDSRQRWVVDFPPSPRPSIPTLSVIKSGATGRVTELKLADISGTFCWYHQGIWTNQTPIGSSWQTDK